MDLRKRTAISYNETYDNHNMELRKKPAFNYEEPHDPPLDEYVYCDECGEEVFEYCSIHGPLLVIPDDKVPVNHSKHVPRSALTVPRIFLHLAPSIIPGAGIGVFATLTLPSGVRFGPYRGKNAVNIRSNYCWQLYDDKRRTVSVVDASDENSSNWMRYVNCSRHWREQNLVAYQYQGQIYYRTIKIIPRFTELMVFYGGEFARQLGVNLKHYNSDEHYHKIVELPVKQVILEESNIIQNTNNYVEFMNFEEDIDAGYQSNIQNETTFNENNNSFNINEHTIEDFVIIDDKIHKNVIDGVNESDINQQISVQYNEQNKCFELDFSPTDSSRHSSPQTKNTTDNQCHICQRSFKLKSSLRRHNRKLHGSNNLEITKKVEIKNVTNRIFSCNRCSYVTFQKPYYLTRHIRSVHPSCHICGLYFVSVSNLSSHLDTNHFGLESNKLQYIYKCDNCLYITNQKYQLSRHMRTHKMLKA